MQSHLKERGKEWVHYEEDKQHGAWGDKGARGREGGEEKLR